VTKGEIVELLRRQGVFTEESLEFQAKLLERSGTGEATHWPPSITQFLRPELALRRDAEGKPLVPARVDQGIDGARAVAERTMFQVVEKVLASTGTKAREIDFLVVNCSLFCPTPSLAASVARRFGLRADCRCVSIVCGGSGGGTGLGRCCDPGTHASCYTLPSSPLVVASCPRAAPTTWAAWAAPRASSRWTSPSSCWRTGEPTGRGDRSGYEQKAPPAARAHEPLTELHTGLCTVAGPAPWRSSSRWRRSPSSCTWATSAACCCRTR
jgi:hypothetical protein